MKQLQHNFTTHEQSKKLLDLGLPADSADCYYTFEDGYTYPRLWHVETYKDWTCKKPCWSAGRLIEIIEICFGGFFNSRYWKHTLMEDILLKIEEYIDDMNLAKLE